MHILVTGGAGFLGSNLCRSLLRAGNQVTAFDNFSTGSPENVGDLLGDPNFDLIEGDVIQPLPKLSVGGSSIWLLPQAQFIIKKTRLAH